MACQFVRWLVDGAGQAVIQFTLLAIGGMLMYEAFSRRKEHRRGSLALSNAGPATARQQRRAA